MGKEKFEGNLGLQLGVSHGFGHGYRAWFQYRSNGADHTVLGTKTESDFEEFNVGLGKTTALNDNANMFSSIRYTDATLEVGKTNEEKTSSLIATIGLEADVKEWLTVRASLSQDILGVGSVEPL